VSTKDFGGDGDGGGEGSEGGSAVALAAGADTSVVFVMSSFDEPPGVISDV
jgi:hypothetical protein